MQATREEELLRQVASDFGDAIENRDLPTLLDCFTEDCTLDIFNVHLKGKQGVKKWYKWMFGHMRAMRFEQTIGVVDGDTFFEEYVLIGEIHNGKKLQSRQARVMEFEDGKVKSFRLYFDRLQFADSVVRDFASKIIVKKFIDLSVKEMLQ